MKYTAVYKCRLCGEEFEGADEIDTLVDILYGEEFKKYPFETHFCKNEGIGLADLIGCKRVEENE